MSKPFHPYLALVGINHVYVFSDIYTNENNGSVTWLFDAFAFLSLYDYHFMT